MLLIGCSSATKHIYEVDGTNCMMTEKARKKWKGDLPKCPGNFIFMTFHEWVKLK